MDHLAEHPIRQREGESGVNFIDPAKGKWFGILSALGVDPEVLNKRRHFPCPANGQGVDRFRWSDKDGAGRFFCACSDGSKSGYDLLMCCRGWTFKEAKNEVKKIVNDVSETQEKPSEDPSKRLNETWARTKKTNGETVAAYLRGRLLEPNPVLRQGREEYWHDGKKVGAYDAMVAQVMSASGESATLHVTFLDGDKKAVVAIPRKILTPKLSFKGGAVRLYPAAATMGVAEGIETALAAAKLWKIPVWACLNADNLSEFVPPPEAKKVLIFGDNDANFTGHAAAYKLARRLSLKGLEALPLFPADVGQDWNDVLVRHETCEDMPKETGVRK